MVKRSVWFILLIIVLLFPSCVSFVNLEQEDSMFFMGNFTQVKTMLESKEKIIDDRQGKVVKFLDFGMVDHAARNYEESNNALENAEKEIDRLYTKSISKNIGTLFINDNVDEYSGEAWENIYCNIFKSLNYYFLGRTDEAMVEVRRSIEKQKDLVDSYPAMEKAINDRFISNDFDVPSDFSQDFVSSALARYLAMVFSYETKDENTFYYSINKLKEAFEVQPKLYDFPVPSSLEKLENADSKTTIANCLVFTGRAPFKQEVRSTYSYFDSNGDYKFVNYSIPKAVQRPSSIARITVDLQGEQNYNFALVPLERLDNIAMDTMEAQVANDTVKTLIRMAGKEFLYQGVKYSADNAEDKDSATGLHILAAIIGIFNDVSENADVRNSHFFPSTAWVGIENIEPGTYTAIINYYDRYGSLLVKQEIANYRPTQGKANLLEGFMPR